MRGDAGVTAEAAVSAGPDEGAREDGPGSLGNLREEPTAYAFFQAVRLLHRELPGRSPVGRFAHPGDELLRFGVRPDLAFPPGEIDELEARDDAPWRMSVNFMDLVGHMGVLPVHYSVLVKERLRNRDRALKDFLDLFHHRLVSLFYRAWERHRSWVPLERGEPDRLTSHLEELVGLGGDSARRELGLEARALLGYAGLLAPTQRSALALERVIGGFFDVPVKVEQFVGGWYEVSESARCHLDDEEPGEWNRLGGGALVGDGFWDPHARARIVIGPLDRDRFEHFLPDGEGYRALAALTRFFTDDQVEFELKLILKTDEVPRLRLGVDDSTPLAWETWLGSRADAPEDAETVLTLAHTPR